MTRGESPPATGRIDAAAREELTQEVRGRFGSSVADLYEAASAVADEWDQRGDGGCSLSIQLKLAIVLDRIERAISDG